MFIFMKKYLQNALKYNQKKTLKKIYKVLMSNIYKCNLEKLADIQGTDKGLGHYYIRHYSNHFNHLRKRKLNILEIGVGGAENPETGGGSLRMWKYYFPKSKFYGIDIYDKSKQEEKRIKIFKGNQAAPDFLRYVFKETNSSLDIVIDDGSHKNEHVITTFKILFPLINNGGIYVIEDTQTSYWPALGGDSIDLNNPKTTMNFFKYLTDCLNYEEFDNPGYVPTYFDKHIISLHFYHNLTV